VRNSLPKICFSIFGPLLLAVIFQTRASDAQYSEEDVKAGFIANFLQLTEFPRPTSSSVVSLCLAGQADFSSVKTVMASKVIGNRRVRVDEIPSASSAAYCDAIYIARGCPNAAEILQAVRGKSVLTIGDSPDFLRLGGMINFYLEESKVRFEVRLNHVEQEGIRLSSRLLQFARITQPEVP